MKIALPLLLVSALTAVVAGSEMDAALDDAESPGAEAAANVRARDLDDFVVRKEGTDDAVISHRLGRAILHAAKRHDGLYRLLGPDGESYTAIVCGQETSPRIVAERNTPISIQIDMPDPPTLRVTAYDPRSGFIERFTVDAKAVRPASPEVYRHILAEAAASHAAFDALFNAMSPDEPHRAHDGKSDSEPTP